MGTKNRERRKAKQKARYSDRRHPGTGRPHVEPTPLDALVNAYLAEACFAIHEQDIAALERCVAGLADSPGVTDSSGGNLWRRVVNRTVMTTVQHYLGHVWEFGWQPADVARMIVRRRGARHARMAVDVMAAQMRRYAPATVDERWEAQLAALGASVWWADDDSYLEGWADREGIDRPGVLRCALEVLYLLRLLPKIEVLCPLPGAARRGSLHTDRSVGRPDNQRMLDRVRALLAKAESTEFTEEAEALTAKAQELMARHSIDYALLAAQTGSRDQPGGIRVGIDNPYEMAKAVLLQNVASANRCRSMWIKELGFSTVLGFHSDLEAVELLYTSLLVQATAAMVQAGTRRDRSGRSRTRSFRQSFLQAYAVRIGQRLRDATQGVSTQACEAEGAGRLLPVLAARDDAVKDAFESMFPDVHHSRVTVSNGEGWASGTAAADLATLHTRQAVREDDPNGYPPNSADAAVPATADTLW